MNRIEELIKEKGYSMTSFAERMGTTRQNLYAILKSPSYPTLERVSAALGVPLWQLFVDPKDISTSASQQNAIICPHCGRLIKLTASE